MTETPINRVTLDELEAAIKHERYLNLGDSVAIRGVSASGESTQVNGAPAPTFRTTLCVLVLDNDIVVVGKSACIDDRLFEAKVGREIARRDAIAQVWPLLGMRLADKIANSLDPLA